MKKEKTHLLGDAFIVLIMMVALAVFLYAGARLLGFYKEYQTGSKEYDNLEASDSTGQPQDGPDSFDSLEDDAALSQLQQEVEDTGEAGIGTVQKVNGRFMVTAEENGTVKALPTMNNPIDFEELKAINPDICGWLRIRAIDISYPLVQGEDNEYYLHRTFEQTANFAGCLFLNAENKTDFTDQNTIIYGHNMKNGSMFGKLNTFRDKDVYKKSRYFWIFTPDFIYQYRIISGMVVPEAGDTYRTFFSEDKFQEFLDTVTRGSELDITGVEVDTEDRVVTLSTCTGDNATRFVVIGKLAQVYVPKDKVKTPADE